MSRVVLPPSVADLPRLLTIREVAQLFGVCRATVLRWEQDGKVTALRTPGNHRRYKADDIRALLNPGNVTP